MLGQLVPVRGGQTRGVVVALGPDARQPLSAYERTTRCHYLLPSRPGTSRMLSRSHILWWTAFGRIRISNSARWSSPARRIPRSEEHTSELQSLMRISYAVFCLKKKK